MQHCAGFISAESLYMFRASSAHHQEYCIKLVFYLTYTTMQGNTKIKFKV